MVTIQVPDNELQLAHECLSASLTLAVRKLESSDVGARSSNSHEVIENDMSESRDVGILAASLLSIENELRKRGFDVVAADSP